MAHLDQINVNEMLISFFKFEWDIYICMCVRVCDRKRESKREERELKR